MIGIVFINDLNMCPYADKYLDAIDKSGEEYEFILWNRKGIAIPLKYRNVSFTYISDIYGSKFRKAIGFIKYQRFVREIIKRKKYKKLILLTTLSAFLCGKKILEQYRNKYVFDIRDLSYEQNRWFYKFENKIIKDSNFTAISSKGFLDVLPKHDYLISHNFRYDDLNKAQARLKKDKGPIRILQIGISRGEQFNLDLCDMFGGDPRFELEIAGSGCDTFAVQTKANKFLNVSVTGEYRSSEKKAFIDKADMLMYYYTSNFNCNRALANKYYDGLINTVPLIGNSKTFSGKLLQENGMGVSIDNVKPESADLVFNYYHNLDFEFFKTNCNRILEEIIDEDMVYVDRIKCFVNEQ